MIYYILELPMGLPMWLGSFDYISRRPCNVLLALFVVGAFRRLCGLCGCYEAEGGARLLCDLFAGFFTKGCTVYSPLWAL